MDVSAVINASEKTLEHLGLIKAGDRLNLVAFCKDGMEEQKNDKLSGENPKEDSSKTKRALLEAFLSRKSVKKNSRSVSALPSSQERKKRKERIKTKKIQLGWKHYKDEEERYVLVPFSKGGGSRFADVPLTMDRFELLQLCKNTFFPNGQSVYGKQDDMLIDLSNFKGEEIEDNIMINQATMPFNVGNYMEAYKIKSVRVYLQSKKAFVDNEENDDDLYKPTFSFNEEDVTPAVTRSESLLIGSSEDRYMIKEEQDKAYKLSLEADRKKEEQKHKERVQDARKARLPPCRT